MREIQHTIYGADEFERVQMLVQRSKQSNHIEAEKDRRKEKAKEIKIAEDAETKKNFISNLKIQFGCDTISCDETEYFVLLLHHEGKKTFAFHEVKFQSWSSIIEELKSCIVLCHNCHIKKHFK